MQVQLQELQPAPQRGAVLYRSSSFAVAAAKLVSPRTPRSGDGQADAALTQRGKQAALLIRRWKKTKLLRNLEEAMLAVAVGLNAEG
jgi:hypothetical protein